ncbi:MAG: isoprenoid biosynthesis protein ElbB [Deltaproteobacteria bacterium]|nr:MAG: isoprenoid biosynthesis protein ElbB [Deltaproteobacteria bacterium]PIE74949.1 MAG: isoprenoid biosynthesis protein ElbB [Deltaproteobacteria bacterium]
MPSTGIILSGCGVNDGTEIHEAVITLLCLEQKKSDISFFAPDMNQSVVIDHTTGNPTTESRNIKIESARISRGKTQELSMADPEEIDALILPGGTGAVRNLSKIAENPGQAQVNENLKNLILKMHSMKKPIGAISISPIIIAAILSDFSSELTTGNDINTAQLIKSFNCIHRECNATDICFDEKNLIVTTPGYMLAKNTAQVYEGISKLVDKIFELI